MENETYLTFILGNEYFAVNVKYVLEVLEHRIITPVPQAPPHILGILNFRGEILPVADTRYKFNLPAKPDDAKSIIIVYEITKDEQIYSIASTADAVKDVIEINKEEIKPIPEIGISYDNRFISGVVKRDEKFILLLNIEKVFDVNDSETINCQETAIHEIN
jgi:purine-binding chemotaxis protein CheW